MIKRVLYISRFRNVAVIATVAVSGLALTSCAGEEAGQEAAEEQAAASCTTPECKLASIETGETHSDTGDSETARYSNILDLLESRCQESRTRLGDFAVVAQQRLDEEGVLEESLWDILANVNRSIPDSMQETRCADVFASYVVLRTSG